ncbi:hypothetical protein H0264_35720 [Nocardia huaxiensis]|uniref:Protein kinase domain-containing protein n=1 Tax=Nocardia huaxiensis TaxID=2755382 RepID=A0A7D6VAH7_9NOCA|nr:hypothetical protein [Nocardia huaxiensis]QLY30413.1 hypothetical protein H0264_35720 [Nocardia huaxiensis]
MSLPSLLDYQQAVLHPNYAFPRDPDLRVGTAVLTPLKIAAVASGGFAATFQIDSAAGGRSYAVRCFHKLGADDNLAVRYEHIARFVAGHRELEFLIDVRYDPTGIVVGGGTYPTVRMPWVVGDPLGDWVDDHFDEPDAIDEVRRNIQSAVRRLRAAGAAHGDLQHGNIMVSADHRITLIDYDGMYLADLAPFGAAERGHPNYQHPARDDNTFDAELDAFSAAVIDLSLQAIAHNDDLWDRFGGTGQNLIFTAKDFADPDKSEVFNELLKGPLAAQAQSLKNASLTGYEHVPQALRGKPTPPRIATVTARSAFDVLLASHAAAIRKRQGDQITVVGTITAARIRKDWRGNPMAFLNFGDFTKGDFTIVAFGPVASELQRRFGGRDLGALQGARVALTELVTLYENNYRTSNLTPQMVLSRANQLRILDSDAYAALIAVAGRTASPRTGTQPTTPPPRPSSTATATATTSGAPRSTQHASAPGSPAAAGDLLNMMQSRFPASAKAPSLPKRNEPSPQSPSSPTLRPRPAATQRETAQPTWQQSTRSPYPPPVTPYNPPTTAHYPARPAQPQGRRRGCGSIIAILALIAVLILLVLLTSWGQRKSNQPPPSPETVRFRSPSSNLSCIATLGVPASIRCDANNVQYQPPPPPPGCDPIAFGRSILLTAGQEAVFICPSDSIVDPTIAAFEYGTSMTIGPFACESDTYAGITCRDIATGRGFRIERDSYELF